MSPWHTQRILAYELALAEAVRILAESHPRKLTLHAICTAAGRARSWAYQNGLSSPAAILDVVSQALIAQMVAAVEQIDPGMPTSQRIAEICGILVPEERHRAYAWALVSGVWEDQTRLAGAIQRALAMDAGEYAELLGVGVIGVARAPCLPDHAMSRAMLHHHLFQMIGRVERFEHPFPDEGKQ